LGVELVLLLFEARFLCSFAFFRFQDGHLFGEVFLLVVQAFGEAFRIPLSDCCAKESLIDLFFEFLGLLEIALLRESAHGQSLVCN